jgi:uncharacterized protein
MHASRTPSRISSAGALCVSLALMAGSAQAGDSDVYISGGGGHYEIGKIRTMRDMRFTQVVNQKYDFSCGSAAVATLLTYHYNHPVSEKDVMSAMFMTGDQDKIRKEGFSLLDMKNYLEAIGYRAEGYKQSLDKLAKVGIPAIALINRRGYLHFVVVKGVSEDRVVMGDPTLGIRTLPRDDFEKMWNGIIFVILNQKSIGQSTFNTAHSWSPHGSPNFRGMLDNGQLGSMTVNISMTPNYF